MHRHMSMPDTQKIRLHALQTLPPLLRICLQILVQRIAWSRMQQQKAIPVQLHIPLYR